MNSMYDSQVPINAHQTDKEDPAVKSNIKNTQDNFAHSFSKQPLIAGLVGLERKGTHQEKISDSQVEEAHVGHAAEPRPTNNDPDDQRVSQKAKEEENGIEGWKKTCSVILIHTLLKVTVKVVKICGKDGVEGYRGRTGGKQRNESSGKKINS